MSLILQGVSNEAAYDFFTQVHEDDDRELEDQVHSALASPAFQGGESHFCSFQLVSVGSLCLKP
jgi:hypothetical protein